MNSLQFKQFAIYLPHGLKIAQRGLDADYKASWEIEFVKVVDIEYKYIEPTLSASDIFKPLLLPLGDLTLINQATGNPYFIDVLQVVCPLPFQGRNNKFWKCMITGTEHKVKSTGFLEIDNKFNDYSFSIDLENGDLLIYHGDDLSVPDGLFNYFNELAKYHFDFQSLLTAGLALNKLHFIK